ncbi:hypothetical protein [Leptospira kmetyi]|uniref:DUF350 domain-containing protein n=1 Tax=Leptospira kmetyi TaxID=408139 RepID=A0A2M9XSB3_9LEPT|nr:hypothetical protein [Leptospira kmetyi]AYV56258.1 hypothetical protein EFP84_12545 [Leptospira kmetyi]EQA53476.1 hypothetical protein LEP1GSC052_3903 [Leptospira kmetyi serovar Malaysia str. Bejo-Iso9]PJZ29921.1 hypothetical protein CH378_09790 [Leptospira kmetyi]PJZ42013.1 hypothetical protein CH370_07095 [Leptospira kmetyi]TGL64456.1 hypothetical protein EHQ67_20055 [Leptospira kmetyi]
MLLPEKILILAGVLNLAYGSLTGFPYALARKKAEYPSRYLQAAHIGSLMQGAMLLGLVVAFRYANLSENLALIGASLFAVSSLFLALKDTANWLQGIKDEFQENPVLGKLLGAIGVVTNLAGIFVIIYGVLST